TAAPRAGGGWRAGRGPGRENRESPPAWRPPPRHRRRRASAGRGRPARCGRGVAVWCRSCRGLHGWPGATRRPGGVEPGPTPPGGGYGRHYYDLDLPGTPGGEAGYHCDRGWIFVACDHLGVGESTVPPGNVLSYENVARANYATVKAVMAKLEGGELLPELAPVAGAVTLGIGQSMGGCFTIVLQGQHAPFDGIASLGYSAIHTVVPGRPGAPQPQWPW